MFPVGQLVWHRDGKRSGRVLECAGGRVYIEQDNGSELDFAVSDMTATPPAGTSPTGTPPTGARPTGAYPPGVPGSDRRSQGSAAAAGGYAMPNRHLIAADITPDHVRVLGLIPVRTVQAVAALYERRPGAQKFSTLDVAGKLNAIAQITAVPYRTMREYHDRPGELGMLMGKGLADSQKQAR